jgi:hypothetical protein
VGYKLRNERDDESMAVLDMDCFIPEVLFQNCPLVRKVVIQNNFNIFFSLLKKIYKMNHLRIRMQWKNDICLSFYACVGRSLCSFARNGEQQ